MEKKNLILDLGGVILKIDYQLTINAFKKIGMPQAEKLYSQQSQIPLFDQLEKGEINETDFFRDIRSMGQSSESDDEIRRCWNSLIIELPEENVKRLYELKKSYRLFLLSNTNSIHEIAYREMIIQQYGSFVFDDIFEKMYLSHLVHLREPSRDIFEFVIADGQLEKSETLFIDDSIQHVEAARKSGIDSVLFPAGKLLKEVI